MNNVQDISLTGFLNKFRQYQAAPPVANQPTPDMIAARYALTGLSMRGVATGPAVAGINTARDKIGRQAIRPYIRRDFDSLIGFSADLPVQTDITFFPNPPRNRTLKKDLQVRYSYPCGDQVRRLRHCYDEIVLMILVIPPPPHSMRPSWTTNNMRVSLCF